MVKRRHQKDAGRRRAFFASSSFTFFFSAANLLDAPFTSPVAAPPPLLPSVSNVAGRRDVYDSVYRFLFWVLRGKLAFVLLLLWMSSRFLWSSPLCLPFCFLGGCSLHTSPAWLLFGWLVVSHVSLSVLCGLLALHTSPPITPGGG